MWRLVARARTERWPVGGSPWALPSNSDDFDEPTESTQGVRVSGVEGQPVGVGGGGDEQVSDTAAGGTARLGDGGDNLAVTASSGGVEWEGFEGGLDLLEASLTSCSFVAGRGQMRAGGQLGQGDRTDRSLVGEGGGDVGGVPVDHHRRVEKSCRHLQALIDDAIEVGPELGGGKVWPGGSEGQELGLGHEGAMRPPNWPELGHRYAVAGNEEGLSGGDLVDHPCVVVPELALGDGLGHRASVAPRATIRYRGGPTPTWWPVSSRQE